MLLAEKIFMDSNRKYWNVQQQALRRSLAIPEEHSKSIELFIGQHAMVHAAALSGAGLWSFEDEVLAGVSPRQMRLIPAGFEHSIAWVVWHMTRIEDVTMNLLAADSPQLMLAGGWLQRLGVELRDTGNAMSPAGVAGLSAQINLEALREYRMEVAGRTRAIAKGLQPQELRRKVDPRRLQQVRLEGAVVEAATDLLDYWGGLTLAGLLLMPPTRHNFVHWNEALKIKQKVSRQTDENP